MGMDIYLEAELLKAQREKAEIEFDHWVKLRDAEKDKRKRAKLQKQVWKWFNAMDCAKNGYFRVNYNDYSLSYWLQYNVDERAKGDWGLEPFYSAVKDRKEPMIRSERFRQELLKTARGWYRKAVKLKGRESYLMALDWEKSDLKKGKWVRKKVVLKGAETNEYIRWLKDLVVFAELAVKTKSPIYVSY